MTEKINRSVISRCKDCPGGQDCPLNRIVKLSKGATAIHDFDNPLNTVNGRFGSHDVPKPLSLGANGDHLSLYCTYRRRRGFSLKDRGEYYVGTFQQAQEILKRRRY